ncbi:MAG: hypothetical protein JW715_06960 [Sedimentisphaerales bacterium]|nr:hypothetical protein [Sedimentisphaerales bacterium]
MRILRVVFILITAGLTGCGPGSYWYNPEKNLDEARRDCRKCHKQAQMEAINAAIEFCRQYNEPFTGWSVYKNTQFKKCMKDKGYNFISEDRLDPIIRKRTVEYGDELYYISGK